MLRRNSKKPRVMNPDIVITAFMNLMVVLVPFLLITAVFSQVSILNLNLPEGASESIQTEDEPPKALEVIIRKNKFDVLERNSGLLKSIPNIDSGYDYKGLNNFLQEVKAHPEFNTDTGLTLLMEMDTNYNTLVQTMDAARLIVLEERVLDENGNIVQGELFPNISMGDAPPDEAGDENSSPKVTTP